MQAWGLWTRKLCLFLLCSGKQNFGYILSKHDFPREIPDLYNQFIFLTETTWQDSEYWLTANIGPRDHAISSDTFEQEYQ